VSKPAVAPVIYEVALELDPRIVGEYDTWLELHMREVLEQEGFEAGRVFRLEPPADDGWSRRVVQYHVRSRDDLDAYLAGPAEALRAKGLERFGTRFRASRRVLVPSSELATPSTADGADTVTECPNCGGANLERFCANCGQDNKVSVVSFGKMLHDFFGDLFNFDSRMFNSLWPLLVRPGLLTKEYLAGRRARFIPPVRMYLFTSLFFFGVVALFVTSDQIDFGDDDRPRAAAPASAAAAPPSLPRADAPATASSQGDFGIRVNGDRADVEFTDADTGWLKDAEDRASHNVLKLKDDPDYRQLFIERGVGNLPVMMFLLLPVFALLLKVLYVRSGRYYVEHLIYSLHLHCQVFLVLGSLLAWVLVLDMFERQPEVPGPLVAAFWTWFVLYPWFAMRRVYGQGWFKTTAKYLLLGVSYVVLLAIGLVGAILLTLST
jgi:hypothetical protein